VVVVVVGVGVDIDVIRALGKFLNFFFFFFFVRMYLCFFNVYPLEKN
jgi:hypothetical protein